MNTAGSTNTGMDQAKRPWLMAAVAVTTASTMVLELSLTRIYSVVMYYHFAFLAISVALFGLGAAGVYLYVRPSARSCGLFPFLHRNTLLAAGFTVIALIVVLHTRIGLRLKGSDTLALTTAYIASALPFFFAGMVVTSIVEEMKRDMGRLYFFDLAGAGAGCLVLVPVLDILGGPGSVLLSGAAFAASGVLLYMAERRESGHLRLIAAAGISILISSAAVAQKIHPFLDIPSVKGTNERHVVFSGWNSFSRVTVEKTGSDYYWLKMDSSAATRIFSGKLEQKGWEPTRRFSEIRVASLVYNLPRKNTALIIGPGGGADVISALYFGRKDILGVELNPIIVRDVMLDRFLDYSGRLYKRPGVHIVVDEGRTFIRSSNRSFSSIQATLVDTWAATAAGAFTLSENNLYTKEAFKEYIKHLDKDGILTMTRWRHNPPREFIRLLVMGRAALEDMGIGNPDRHFYVAADNRMATFLLKRTPFEKKEVETLDRATRRDRLRRYYSPFAEDHNAYAELIRASDWRRFVSRWKDDISPPSDDKPFFFYTIKPGDLVSAISNPSRLSKDNLGLFLLLLALLIVLVLALLCFVSPLLLFRRDVLKGRAGKKARFLGYFMGLGFGYIIIEMAMMQKFILLLGHPVYALTVILFGLLVASGLGSYKVRDLAEDKFQTVVIRNLVLLVVILLVYSFTLPGVFRLLAPGPRWLKAISAVALLFPLGLIMGSFLPLGIRWASSSGLGEMVAWAWGLNGAASVLGSIVAVALAMNLGFDMALAVGMAAYVAGALSWRPGVRGISGAEPGDRA